MPLFKCQKNGKSGWKFGRNNKTCFTGPDKFKKEMKKGEAKQEILDILNNEKNLIPNEIEALMLVADLSVDEVMKVFDERTKFLK